MARVNLPPLTRALLLTLITFTLLNAVIKPEYTALGPFTRTGNGTPYIAVIPRTSWKYPWTFATATFVEQNVFGLIVTGLSLFYGGRYLERAWSSNEFAKFILFVGMVPNLLCFSLYSVLFVLSKSDKALDPTISGGIAIQAGFLVAFKQLVPEHTVSLFKGIIRMRVKHFPAIFLLLNTISGLLLGTETALFLSWIAFLSSWTYLRFFRVAPFMNSSSTENAPTIKGDASDTFAFAYFFPEPFHTPIAAISDKLYELLSALRIVTPFSAEDIESGNENASARAEGGLPTLMSNRGSGRREEAERRRVIALKALDQRLHAASRAQSAGPSMAIPVPTVRQDSPSRTKIEASGSGNTKGGKAAS